MEEEKIDMNDDGVVSKEEQQLYEKKAVNRRRMAWLSLIAMVATAFCLMFVVPENRLDKLKDMLDLYWIALGGVVGTYVGISTWMTKR